MIEGYELVIESKIFYHDFPLEIVIEGNKIMERLFLVKKVKTSFCHDLMIYTKSDASLTSESESRVIGRLYFFCITCFSLILGVSKPPSPSCGSMANAKNHI